jgi:mono/diheme cytochrome c family protein
MIAVILASTVFAGTGTCHVPVQRVVAHQVNYGHQAVAINYGHQNYTPYYTASALAYRVEDPEKAAYIRQNEKLTDALIGEAKASRDRADRNEAALSQGGGGQGSPTDIPKLSIEAKSAAPAILKASCLKCHGGDKSQGGFTLAIGKDGSASLATRTLVFDVVSQGDMPPKSSKALTEDEKKAIAEWASASREELKAAAKGVAAK